MIDNSKLILTDTLYFWYPIFLISDISDIRYFRYCYFFHFVIMFSKWLEKVSTWKSLSSNKKYFHKVGPRKLNFILFFKIFWCIFESFSLLFSEIQWRSGAFKGPGSTILASFRKVSTQNDQILPSNFSQNLLEKQQNKKIPEPSPSPWSTCFSY